MSNPMDKALKTLQKEVEKYRELGSPFIKVGLPDDRFHNPSGLRLSEIGAIHEFGLGVVPERSFLRGGATANKKKIDKQLKIAAKNVKNGANPSSQLEAIALSAQGMIQEFISEGIPPPNIGNPPGKTPLIRSGELLQSIIGVVVND